MEGAKMEIGCVGASALTSPDFLHRLIHTLIVGHETPLTLAAAFGSDPF